MVITSAPTAVTLLAVRAAVRALCECSISALRTALSNRMPPSQCTFACGLTTKYAPMAATPTTPVATYSQGRKSGYGQALAFVALEPPTVPPTTDVVGAP